MLEEIGPKPTEFNEFLSLVLMSHPMGSRYVCNPPIMDTDRDTLILVTHKQKAFQLLVSLGWECCSEGEYLEGAFFAMRKGEDNYILTESPEIFQRYTIATAVAKELNAQDKHTRIRIHKACVEASGGFTGLIDWSGSDTVWQTFPYLGPRITQEIS